MGELTCQFCGLTSTVDSGDFQLDKRWNRGFWCEACDGFTYFSHCKVKHRFTLILENKAKNLERIPIPRRKFSKRLSPYRYPGGKSRMIDYLYVHLQKAKSKKLISPFTGGGSFELAMLNAGVVEELHLNDIDTGVYAFWWVVTHMPYALIDRIQNTRPTHREYFAAQSLIHSDYWGADLVDAAWASLLVNRLAYSGIVKANPLGGRRGKQKDLLSRWNPTELIKRINKIYTLRNRIEVTQMDARELIETAYWEENATIFIDPPYVKKGKELYHCYYNEKDHRELAWLLNSLYHGMPGADILVTYDDNEWIVDLYEYAQIERIGRVYSA